jgi:hypothetical protein
MRHLAAPAESGAWLFCFSCWPDPRCFPCFGGFAEPGVVEAQHEPRAAPHLSREERVPNKRIEFAPFGRPTRKQRCCLLAAHSRRWAVAHS